MILTACQTTGPKTEPSKILVHGHRGSRGTHPENTLPALEEAVAAGADILEFDLHLTKDGIPVLSHDARIPEALCTDSHGKAVKKGPFILRLTLKQVKTYDCGSLRNPRFAEQTPIKGTKIPTLDEVLTWANKTAPRLQLNIETKMDATDKKLNPDPEFFAKTVITLLKKHNAIDRTILQSFDFTTLHAARKIEPGLRLAALWEFEKNFCDETKKLGFPYASPSHDLLTPEQIKKCHEAGIQVAPWTLNDEATWAKAVDLGVDSIITDYPRKLKAYLKK